MNNCGTCTLCCRLTEVPELAKPFNKWCNFCNPDQGCSIYSERPESCQTFACVWLRKGLHEKLRPDHCKVLFEILNETTFLAIVHPVHPDVWKTGITAKLISEILRDGISIVIITPGKPNGLLLAKNRTVESIQEDLDVALKVHNERVNEWQSHPIQLT